MSLKPRLSDTGRHLTATEQRAAARLSATMPSWPNIYIYGHGPIHWARGTYWPNRLRDQAVLWQQMATDALLIAAAMEREEP